MTNDKSIIFYSHPISSFVLLVYRLRRMDTSTMIKVTKFSRRLADQLILYEILRYPDRCLFIWIGAQSCELSNLAMTMPMINSSNELLGTTLFGSDFYEQSLSLSKKLARRLGGKKQIYVSLNLVNDADNETLLHEIEQALFEHVRQNEDVY